MKLNVEWERDLEHAAAGGYGWYVTVSRSTTQSFQCTNPIFADGVQLLIKSES